MFERMLLMPVYLGQDVSDDYLQGLIEAYRDGYKKAGGEHVEDGDQPIIDELTDATVVTPMGAAALGAKVAKAEAES